MPVSSSNASRCSLKVRSELDFRCSGSYSLKAALLVESLLGIFMVSTPPGWHLLLGQRLTVGRGPKEFRYLYSRDATVEGGRRRQSEYFRVCVHREHPHARPLVTQAAGEEVFAGVC